MCSVFNNLLKKNNKENMSSNQDDAYWRDYEIWLDDDVIEKLHALRNILQTDLMACDAKWTLFVAAAHSYRYNSLLKPFPPGFSCEIQGPNVKALIKVIRKIHDLQAVLKNICESRYEELDIEAINLLHYVLVLQNEATLQSVSQEEFDELLRSMGSDTRKVPRPKNIFKVTTPEVEQQSMEGPKLAFYWNQLDSFYTMITRIGTETQQPGDLDNKTDNEESLLLLSTDLGISVKRSPKCGGWGGSRCGAVISCIALCEIDNREEFVTWSKDKTNIEVRNKDLMRIRYLLFYEYRVVKGVVKSVNDNEVQELQGPNWLHQIMNTLAGFVMVIFLANILWNNPVLKEFFGRIWNNEKGK